MDRCFSVSYLNAHAELNVAEILLHLRGADVELDGHDPLEEEVHTENKNNFYHIRVMEIV